MKGFLTMCIAAFAAAASQAADSGKTFVLWDPGIGLPAICYPLEPGWTGKGAIAWNMRGDNKYQASTILSSPEKHMLVQTAGPIAIFSEVLTPQRLAEFQDPRTLARNLAAEINRSIVEPGLSGFAATGGRFSQDVPELTKLLAKAYDTGSGMTSISAFSFEGTFTCMYGGVRCEAVYTASFAVAVSSVPNARVPAICNFTRVSPVLAVAPQGKMREALREAGRMFASAFENRAWAKRRDGMLQALMKGTALGREAGWELWRQSRKNTSATLTRTRKRIGDMIREVVTVDNPFEPGGKVERPAFFDKAWINSRQDTMLLSDTSIEPNTVRGLMEQGEWRPADP